jgi:hypothetical protein
MTEEEFWYGIEPRAFFNAVEGFESLRKQDLEIARLQTLCIVNSWGAKIEDPRKLWTYPWEKEIVTKEQIEKQRIQAQKAIKRYGG